MGRFLLGALTVFLYYNQGNIRRGYYIITHEMRVVKRVYAEQRPIVQKVFQSEEPFVEPPLLDTSIEIKEPSLEAMEKLGFNVKK